MFQIFRYSFLRLTRNRTNIFWILLFPIILGCFFKVAFSNLNVADSFHTIPTAIVSDDTFFGKIFCNLAEDLTTEDGQPLLDPTICDEETALQLLRNHEVDGVLYAGYHISLSVAADYSGHELNQSILEEMVQQYEMTKSTLLLTLFRHPLHLPEVLSSLLETPEYQKLVPLTDGNNDPYLQYFYNLIAMACLYTAIGGVLILKENQGNLSTLAARKNVSSLGKTGILLCELSANILFEFLLNLLGFLFLIFVLRVDLTTRLPYAVLAIFVSTVTGITLGFFLAVIGPKSEGAMIGMVFAVVMPACFLSGLMVGNMRILIETSAPILNRINPAALISDSFYSLNIYETMTRYWHNIFTLLILSAIFVTVGLLFTRRKKYASI